MQKDELIGKINGIINAGVTFGIEAYACLKGETGFILEKMVAMDSLKTRIRSLMIDVINTQYLDNDIEYDDVVNVSDNKKSIYMLQQDTLYHPFQELRNIDSVDRIFKEENINDIMGFIFKINLNNSRFFAYQQAFVGSKLKAHNALRIIHKGEDKFDVFDENLLKLDKRAELLIVEDVILIKNLKVLQDNFGFQTYVRGQALNVIDSLETLDIVSDIEKIKECQMEDKLTVSKKLMKIKNSPVLEMNKEILMERIPTIPRYANIIKIENGKIKTSSIKDVNNLLKLLNDDIVKSELTDKDYDSPSKTILPENIVAS